MSNKQGKEGNIKEIHHRVKNNYQIIISLIELQIKKEDGNKQIFIDLVNRVKSMSLVYETILERGNLEKINFYKYLELLIEEISLILDPGKNVKVEMSLNPESLENNFILNMNVSTTLGIAINEIITNAYKHAFVRKNNDNKISIFIEIKNNVKITIKDNGIGINNEVLKNSNKLGVNLINVLIEEQMKGKVLIYGKENKGTIFEIILDKDKCFIE